MFHWKANRKSPFSNVISIRYGIFPYNNGYMSLWTIRKFTIIYYRQIIRISFDIEPLSLYSFPEIIIYSDFIGYQAAFRRDSVCPFFNEKCLDSEI